jgi:hypothetical protein
MAMREARRQVSREIPDIPPIPERHRNRISRDMDAEFASSGDGFLERHPSFKKRSLTLDIDLGLSLDQDFERVIEAQKVASRFYSSPQVQTVISTTTAAASSRQVSAFEGPSSSAATTAGSPDANMTPRQQRGYLMRQNTKLVAASDKESDDTWKARSAGNSPVKMDRPQSWTVEPWNGKVRPRSTRKRVGMSGPVPPMPGQESNAVAMNPLAEEGDLNPELATEESGERGRLFVKVMGVKDLDLPIPRSKFTVAFRRI